MFTNMSYWTLELASYLSDAPWPATKDELIDYAIRSGAPLEVVENLQSIEDEGESYDSIDEVLDMINQIDSGKKDIDSDRWRLLREELR